MNSKFAQHMLGTTKIIGSSSGVDHPRENATPKAQDYPGPVNPIYMTQGYITPEKAAEWLALNKGNRPVRRWWVNALSGMIEKGYWICSHQGVAFAESGKLIDGQHRLMAIQQSGISVPVCVFWNVPNDAFKVLDAGVKRSTADLTGLERRSAEAHRFAAEIAFPDRYDKLSANAILKIANAGFDELHTRLIDGAATPAKYYGSAPFRVAAIALVMEGYPEEYVFGVYKNLVNFNVDELPPIAKNMIKQVNQGTVTAVKRSDVVTRALKVMCPAYKENKMVRVGAIERVDAYERIRKVLLRAIGEQADQQP
jgi:hypothetical protein